MRVVRGSGDGREGLKNLMVQGEELTFRQCASVLRSVHDRESSEVRLDLFGDRDWMSLKSSNVRISAVVQYKTTELTLGSCCRRMSRRYDAFVAAVSVAQFRKRPSFVRKNPLDLRRSLEWILSGVVEEDREGRKRQSGETEETRRFPRLDFPKKHCRKVFSPAFLALPVSSPCRGEYVELRSKRNCCRKMPALGNCCCEIATCSKSASKCPATRKR